VPSKDAHTKWKDPRPPVWQGLVNGKLVTIYDMAAYEESKRLYPDDPNQDKPRVQKANKVPPFAKQKPAARWNWTQKLEQPLGGQAS
jgi:hypothetical protein